MRQVLGLCLANHFAIELIYLTLSLGALFGGFTLAPDQTGDAARGQLASTISYLLAREHRRPISLGSAHLGPRVPDCGIVRSRARNSARRGHGYCPWD